MESVVLGESWTTERRSQRRMYCSRCSTVKASTLISATQFWFSRASRTVRFFLLEALKIKGAKSFGGVPSSQEEDQKEALAPSPMVTRVAALKRSLSAASFGVSDPTQGFSGAVHSYHNQ